MPAPVPRFPAVLLLGACCPGSASFRVAPDPAGARSAGGALAPPTSYIRSLLHLPATLLPGALPAAYLLHEALLPRSLLTSALYPQLGRHVPAGRVPAPRPSGHPPPITSPGGLRSRGESNVIITNALVILAAVKPDFSCWVTAAMVQALSYHNLQDKRSACAASTRI